MSKQLSEAGGIPVNGSVPVCSFSPVVLPVAGRAVDLQVKVSAPATGTSLPVILLSHGHGPSNFVSSLHGYGPVVDFWAAHGFVVIQPTHEDSMTLGLRDAGAPDAPLYWRSRVTDMHHILDRLDEIEAAVPGLAGRLDRTRVSAAGHSMGGHTVGMLCGQTVTDPADGSVVQMVDDRIKAGVLMAPPGCGEDLAAFAFEHYPILGTTGFSTMTTPALVIIGQNDWHPAFSDRKDWRSDAYFLSAGPKVRLTLFGAEHSLGGVSTYDAAETTDENPERVAVLRALIWAYLRTALYPGDTAWADATAALHRMPEPMGAIEAR
ncbi:chlorophyllase [Streptomyces sp. MBT62]|uniref:alpha/beta hydrolase family protein n=1 Tax=Streptomyces sp. MBT62 TaxID=2800410 RepID=UPI00190E4370|nr:chlorophyllase [Streptomyces sp. MBT62]MBK3567980.1 chlorophyllase [Streptomyces sp. MBT62]